MNTTPLLPMPYANNTNVKPFRVNVMVDVSPVMVEFNRILLMMEAAISQGDVNAYREFERDGAIMRLFEAADHWLEFELGRQRGNIGFDYYLNEYFAKFARFMRAPEFLQAAGIYFSNAVGYLARCLQFAQFNIEQTGGMVAEVTCTPYQGYHLFTYLVTGYYENHLLVDQEIPNTIY